MAKKKTAKRTTPLPSGFRYTKIMAQIDIDDQADAICDDIYKATGSRPKKGNIYTQALTWMLLFWHFDMSTKKWEPKQPAGTQAATTTPPPKLDLGATS